MSLETGIGATVVDDTGGGAICSCSSYAPSVLLMPDAGVPRPSYRKLPLGPPDLTKHRSLHSFTDG